MLTTLLETTFIEAAAIYTLDENRNALALKQAMGPQRVDLPTLSSTIWGQGMIGEIGALCQGRWFEDITVRPEFSERPVSPMRAYVGVPLRTEKHAAIGVLEIFHHQPGWFEQRDVEWLDQVGYLIGLAISNANLFEYIQTLLVQASSHRQ